MNISRKSIIRVFPLLAVFFLFGAASVSTASGQILNEILKRMDEHNKSLTSLRADVTMVKENAQLGGALDTNEGVVIYLPQRGKDALVRIDWKSPKESLAVVNGNYVIYRPALSQAYVGTTKSASGNAKVGGALSFMNMSRAQLKANYEVKYLGNATVKGVETWHLEMTPKARTNYKSAEVWVDGNGMPVRSKVIEHNNDSTTVTLSNLQKNVPVNTKVFVIDFPKKTTNVIRS